jgi:hypothetical protein
MTRNTANSHTKRPEVLCRLPAKRHFMSVCLCGAYYSALISAKEKFRDSIAYAYLPSKIGAFLTWWEGGAYAQGDAAAEVKRRQEVHDYHC